MTHESYNYICMNVGDELRAVYPQTKKDKEKDRWPGKKYTKAIKDAHGALLAFMDDGYHIVQPEFRADSTDYEGENYDIRNVAIYLSPEDVLVKCTTCLSQKNVCSKRKIYDVKIELSSFNSSMEVTKRELEKELEKFC